MTRLVTAVLVLFATAAAAAEPSAQRSDELWSSLKAGDILAITGSAPYQPGLSPPQRVTASAKDGTVTQLDLYSFFVEDAHVTRWSDREDIAHATPQGSTLIVGVSAPILSAQRRRSAHPIAARVEVLGFACDDPPYQICSTPAGSFADARSVGVGIPALVVKLRALDLNDAP